MYDEDLCQCTPGTAENGWHEDRCLHCRDEERLEFMRSMMLPRSMQFQDIPALASGCAGDYDEGER